MTHYTPVRAATHTTYHPTGPDAFDCVTVSFVRDGSAHVFSEFGRQRIRLGDAVLLWPNTLLGNEPDEAVTMTTVYIDRDFLVDQVFWRNARHLTDRMQAYDLMASRRVDAAQVVHLAPDRVGYVSPWLDELVALSVAEMTHERFFRVLSLWFAVLDVVTPFVKLKDTSESPMSTVASRPMIPRHRPFQPLRVEALEAIELLSGSLASRWTLSQLAEQVHLSTSQLSRVFVDSFGKTPLAYLTMLRVEELARLLRSTATPIGDAARQVGWGDPSYAARVFRRCVGMTPRAYRTMCRERNDLRVE